MKSQFLLLPLLLIAPGTSAQAQNLNFPKANDFWSQDFFKEPSIYCPKGARCQQPFADDIPLTLRRMPEGMGILITPEINCEPGMCLPMKGKLGLGLASRSEFPLLEPKGDVLEGPKNDGDIPECAFVSDCEVLQGTEYFQVFGDPENPVGPDCEGDLCIWPYMRGGLDILLQPDEPEPPEKSVPWEGVGGDLDCTYKDCLVTRMFFEIDLPELSEIMKLAVTDPELGANCGDDGACEERLKLMLDADKRAQEFGKFQQECQDGANCWGLDFSILLGATEAYQNAWSKDLTNEPVTSDADGNAPPQPDIQVMANTDDGGNSVDFTTVDKVNPADIPNPNSDSSGGGPSLNVGGASVGVDKTNHDAPTRGNPEGGMGGMVTVTVGTGTN